MIDRLKELPGLVSPFLDENGDLPEGKEGDDKALILWAWFEIKRLRAELAAAEESRDARKRMAHG